MTTRLSEGPQVRLLARLVARGPLPRHVALVMDGNRRWARDHGFADGSVGHRHGAEHLERVLGWCTELGIRQVTAWVASADDIRRRDPAEVAYLMHLAETTIPTAIARSRAWRVHVIGELDLLPPATARALLGAEETTRDLDGAGDLTVAIGYGGRAEIVGAVRRALEDAAAAVSTAGLAARFGEDDITGHLQTVGDPLA